jgi:hypothetical protein
LAAICALQDAERMAFELEAQDRRSRRAASSMLLAYTALVHGVDSSSIQIVTCVPATPATTMLDDSETDEVGDVA